MTKEKNSAVNTEAEEIVNKNGELTEDTASTEGMSIDQAVEVEVEQSDETDAATEELQKEIQLLQGKLEEAENKYLRLHADFDNFRRRTRLDQEAAEKYRAQKLVTDLLPVLDNFERALVMDADNEQTKSLLQGVEMVYRSLLEALKKEGVEPIEAVGEEFDPQFHHAVMQGEDENFGSGAVTQEFQKGYLLKDRVIRPSMVKVNQ
ncbi:nucleotide exchange factor GrpE [Bacillus sp. FJAT-29814]|uniref:nucleotide exchange factor GrpE n=1 Tax=Bacillus sp. FJAT-29814 TaxID=1729688 RepID=UPI000834CA5F|nr:nucleotide exchange factor GrpE [Bacillus sp. FJAT-29814]